MESDSKLNSGQQPTPAATTPPSPPAGPYLPPEYAQADADLDAASAKPQAVDSDDVPEASELPKPPEEPSTPPAEEPTPDPHSESRSDQEMHARASHAHKANNHDKMSWVLVGAALAIGLLAGLGIGYFFINQGASSEAVTFSAESISLSLATGGN